VTTWLVVLHGDRWIAVNFCRRSIQMPCSRNLPYDADTPRHRSYWNYGQNPARHLSYPTKLWFASWSKIIITFPNTPKRFLNPTIRCIFSRPEIPTSAFCFRFLSISKSQKQGLLSTTTIWKRHVLKAQGLQVVSYPTVLCRLYWRRSI
jgi:hypothetical protein